MQFDDDEDRCVVCGVDPTKTRQGLTKRTLLTNFTREARCGHRFCGTCVERGFERKREFDCPVERCGALVRRAQLDPRTLDEMECDRDAAARKRVLAVFNAPASSFETARAHDDYLEQAEDLIYALCRGGAQGAEADRMLQSEASKDADAVARRAAARAESDRLAAAAVEDDRRRADEAASKQRDKRRREKRKRNDARDHAEAFALGDRTDAPCELPPMVLDAGALPAPMGVPQNPRRVEGMVLDARRRAGGWALDVFDKRDARELARGLQNPGPPPYIAPTIYFGQRTYRQMRPGQRKAY
mmetsp:Transcript_12351/g.36704  ORF Transcript_12351/g.36704 Transcript_12351/m.36704 type:complete len:301 (-) Transcript_12351:22-924(-)